MTSSKLFFPLTPQMYNSKVMSKDSSLVYAQLSTTVKFLACLKRQQCIMTLRVYKDDINNDYCDVCKTSFFFATVYCDEHSFTLFPIDSCRPQVYSRYTCPYTNFSWLGLTVILLESNYHACKHVQNRV